MIPISSVDNHLQRRRVSWGSPSCPCPCGSCAQRKRAMCTAEPIGWDGPGIQGCDSGVRRQRDRMDVLALVTHTEGPTSTWNATQHLRAREGAASMARRAGQLVAGPRRYRRSSLGVGGRFTPGLHCCSPWRVLMPVRRLSGWKRLIFMRPLHCRSSGASSRVKELAVSARSCSALRNGFTVTRHHA